MYKGQAFTILFGVIKIGLLHKSVSVYQKHYLCDGTLNEVLIPWQSFKTANKFCMY